MGDVNDDDDLFEDNAPPPSSFLEYLPYSFSRCPYISFSGGMTKVPHYNMDFYIKLIMTMTEITTDDKN